MDRVIIVGANGFLGHSLIKRLEEEGTEIYALINNNFDNLTEYSSTNVRIIKSIGECVISGKKFDAIFHFAWTGNTGEQRGNIDLQIDNIKYACNVLKKSVELGCPKFIFAGSIMEYEAISSLIDLEIKPGLGNIYSSSKLVADLYLKTLAAYYNVPYISLLISNIYGPGERNQRLINSTIRKFILGEKTEFSECTQLYDFIYIDDAVNKFIEIGNKAKSGTYYIGNPEQCQLKDFIISLAHICDKKADEIGIGKLGKTNQIIDYNLIDTSRVEREFGLYNKVSFVEGITRVKEFINGELLNGNRD